MPHPALLLQLRQYLGNASGCCDVETFRHISVNNLDDIHWRPVADAIRGRAPRHGFFVRFAIPQNAKHLVLSLLPVFDIFCDFGRCVVNDRAVAGICPTGYSVFHLP